MFSEIELSSELPEINEKLSFEQTKKENRRTKKIKNKTKLFKEKTDKWGILLRIIIHKKNLNLSHFSAISKRIKYIFLFATKHFF